MVLKKIPIGIVGATGYTGLELLRLSSNHPNLQLVSVTSRQYEGQKLSEVCPFLSNPSSLVFDKLAISKISKKVGVVFLCLPHHESMDVAHQFRLRGVKVIDLSADFRLKEPRVYEEWYGPHTQKKRLKEAIYGLPELHYNDVKKASLVAVPGCYSTSVILALAPLVQQRMIDLQDIICDSKSGVSGAGRQAKLETLFCEVNENFKPYSIGSHRHTPEMEQELSLLSGDPVRIFFSPHLVPMDRGIVSTIYTHPVRRWKTSEVLKIYHQFYQQSFFVKILPEGSFPSSKNVRGTNFCHIGILVDERTERLVIISAIDNLTKGASGQALQCFNLLCGFPEETGLWQT